ncbi:MAG: tryptophan--tRNA ligase [Planctomycetota bacterium]|nr:tryptophan--tRNA ligase [Planctomycetota bacterium]
MKTESTNPEASREVEAGKKPVVLSGIRATGRMHLGNYLGAMRDFVTLSERDDRECFFFVADLHTLTTLPDADQIRRNVPEIVLSYLAAGIDPERSTIYTQSSVPETSELFWLFSNLMPVGELLKSPSYKEKAQMHPDNINAGLLNYPVLMAADILGPRAHFVPVGEDQYTHLENARDIARRFNNRYGDFFPLPQPLQQSGIRVPGLDGTGKMGKSDGNTLDLVDTPDEMWKKLAPAVTDPARKTRKDPGNPDICNIYTIHTYVSTEEELNWVREGCTTAGIGCLDCKKTLHKNISDLLAEYQERHRDLSARKGYAEEVLREGARRARKVIGETVREAQDRMGVAAYRGSS